jgi:hypothetical protein
MFPASFAVDFIDRNGTTPFTVTLVITTTLSSTKEVPETFIVFAP